MKRLALAALAICATVPVFADDAVIAKSTHDLLRSVETSTNTVPFENTKYQLEGYVVRVESKVENGQKLYLAQISDAFVPPKNGKEGYTVNRTFKSRLLCVVDRDTAASMKPKSKIAFTAFTSDVQDIKVAEFGQVNTYKTVIANCQL